MQVKIDDTIYDGAKRPVMVILSPEDKQNISNMADDATKYCSYPEKMSPKEAMEFMEIIREDDDIGSPKNSTISLKDIEDSFAKCFREGIITKDPAVANDYFLRIERGLREITTILGPKVEQYPVEDPRCGIACEAGMALEVAQEALIPPPPEPPPPPPPRTIKEGQLPRKEDYPLRCRARKQCDTNLFPVPPPKKSQVIDPEHVDWQMGDRCFYTGIESGGSDFPVKGALGTIFKVDEWTNKLPIQVIWDNNTSSYCLPVSLGKPRKSFRGWLANLFGYHH